MVVVPTLRTPTTTHEQLSRTTGALVVFVLSQVLTTVDNQTVPLYIYSGIYSGLRGAISPALGAVSAFFIAVVAIAFAVVLRLGKLERFLFRA
ncbi:MAG: hypothetical protein JWR11_5338 [Mycobacterium sp.]|nr:hypothetical protein [Mycobacterium sp.]MDT5078312.1 putative spermidine/putrescine transport system permease protein [Mycobacterium sp.]